MTALRATRRSSLPSLVEHAGVGGGPQALHWRRGMVVAPVALSLVLLCGSLVLSHSLVRLMSVDPGFVVDHLYSFSVDPSQARYDPRRAMAYPEQVLEQLRALPGVSVIAGREFTREDSSTSTGVAVLNESLARVLFGEEDPLGRRIGFAGQPPDIQVVGIVKDMKTRSLRAPVSPEVFLQERGTTPIPIAFVIRTGGQAVSSDAVRAIVKRIMPSVPVVDFGSVADQIAQGDVDHSRARRTAAISRGFRRP